MSLDHQDLQYRAVNMQQTAEDSADITHNKEGECVAEDKMLYVSITNLEQKTLQEIFVLVVVFKVCD